MKVKVIIGFAFAIAVFSSCIGPKKMQQMMEAKTLKYVDLNPEYNKERYEVIYANAKGIEKKPSVGKVANYFIPAIFYWESKSQYINSIGFSTIEDEVSKNFAKALAKYNNDYLESNDLKLVVNIDSIGSAVTYMEKSSTVYLLIAYISQYLEMAGPSKLKINVSYKLQKQDEIICEGNVVEFTNVSPVKRRGFSRKVYFLKHLETYLDQFNKILEDLSVGISKDIASKVEK